ncbi:hypothetical protein FDW88_11635 [Citrobacter sp. wls829]|nr:hypothetical protein FDW88_11635 [Citrobacter sp. wls829]
MVFFCMFSLNCRVIKQVDYILLILRRVFYSPDPLGAQVRRAGENQNHSCKSRMSRSSGAFCCYGESLQPVSLCLAQSTMP